MKKILLKILDRTGLTSKIPRKRIDAFTKKHADPGRTLDIGSAHGPYARYFPNRVSADIAETPGVDVVLDAHDLHMFQDGEFDCVLLTEVLEHLHTPQTAIDEMYRVLKPGGKLILTTRFLFPLHDIPGDYWRFTRYGLEHLMKDFHIVEMKEETSTIGTFAVLFERLAFQCDTLYLKPLGVFWLLLSKFTSLFSFLITREYGDVRRSRQTKNIMTSGYYVYAIKK